VLDGTPRNYSSLSCTAPSSPVAGPAFASALPNRSRARPNSVRPWLAPHLLRPPFFCSHAATLRPQLRLRLCRVPALLAAHAFTLLRRHQPRLPALLLHRARAACTRSCARRRTLSLLLGRPCATMPPLLASAGARIPAPVASFAGPKPRPLPASALTSRPRASLHQRAAPKPAPAAPSPAPCVRAPAEPPCIAGATPGPPALCSACTRCAWAARTCASRARARPSRLACLRARAEPRLRSPAPHAPPFACATLLQHRPPGSCAWPSRTLARAVARRHSARAAALPHEPGPHRPAPARTIARLLPRLRCRQEPARAPCTSGGKREGGEKRNFARAAAGGGEDRREREKEIDAAASG
jgi:hypothetical protein